MYDITKPINLNFIEFYLGQCSCGRLFTDSVMGGHSAHRFVFPHKPHGGVLQMLKLRCILLRFQSCERLSLVKCGVGQNTALHASPAVRNSAVLVPAF